ncbi:hypothetical protein [Wenxinia saemankumensis]|uniref:Aspartate carbamoyltransferase catalytic subunit n=1 Tax=Wenxinia saemankumensis TaxID=1447782 RepID=A0A1M6FYB5_9RHOB|nr:hypothetical protein [Wenxinia saemankumensis]SHJ02748.1 hypothetical protein SAMN05444417_2573 [Wenxinia saemankumensis]
MTLTDPPAAAGPAPTPPAGWEDILAPGERILWQGRPRAGIDWGRILSVEAVFGLVFAGFGLLWTGMAASMAPPGDAPALFSIFPLFGLIFVAIGLHQAIGRHVLDAWRHGRTWYTLTDRAAYIATQSLGRRNLRCIETGDWEDLRLEDGDPGTVWFARDRHQRPARRRNGRMRPARSWTTPVGFRRIDDARRVFGLMRRQMRE